MSGTKHLTNLFTRLAVVVMLLALLMAPAGVALAAVCLDANHLMRSGS